MLDIRIIQPIEESEWISPIVIWDKKTEGKVRIYVDLRKMKDAFLHDLFQTPFIDEVLESIRGKEMYSFNYGFLGYRQVRIVKEDCHKTTFVTKW